MTKKIRQLNDLISLHDNEHKSLSIELNNVRVEYENSTRLIDQIKSDIIKYSEDLVSCMINDAESYVRSYKNVKEYIAYLNNEASKEVNRRKTILNNINFLEENCKSLKIKMKGYELLIDQYESELDSSMIKAQNNEVDDMWLMKRNIDD